ncbi:MAG: hypothetical protein B6D78_15120 [gamma proteobacterium symbiont of Ctena orbiculata]|nr:MAG: hypothetical protein B6D78_15120 [gamma proteobacterium symbiont of Ctena orbiculata]
MDAPFRDQIGTHSLNDSGRAILPGLVNFSSPNAETCQLLSGLRLLRFQGRIAGSPGVGHRLKPGQVSGAG